MVSSALENISGNISSSKMLMAKKKMNLFKSYIPIFISRLILLSKCRVKFEEKKRRKSSYSEAFSLWIYLLQTKECKSTLVTFAVSCLKASVKRDVKNHSSSPRCWKILLSEDQYPQHTAIVGNIYFKEEKLVHLLRMYRLTLQTCHYPMLLINYSLIRRTGFPMDHNI